jgi:peptidyl-prolyl cis-trans isomerase NIMA-interacting 1
MTTRDPSSSAISILLFVAVAASSQGCEDKKGAAPDAAASIPTTSTGGIAPPVSATPTVSAPAVVPDAIAAQHVLVAYKGAEKAPKGVTRSKAEAKKRADEVAAKAKSGTDFSSLVAEYSDDPAAKERQGSVGKFTRDKMAKPFSDAAFALAVDESSGAVETPFGFHVIKRNQ